MRRATSAEGPATFVVDACVIAKWLIPEPDSERALRLLGLVERGQARLLAPALWRVEVANAFWKRSARGDIPVATAETALETLRTLPLEAVPEDGLVEPAFTLAAEAGVTVYDALYATLAFESAAPLVTADRRLAERLRARWPAFGVVALAEL